MNQLEFELKDTFLNLITFENKEIWSRPETEALCNKITQTWAEITTLCQDPLSSGRSLWLMFHVEPCWNGSPSVWPSLSLSLSLSSVQTAVSWRLDQQMVPSTSGTSPTATWRHAYRTSTGNSWSIQEPMDPKQMCWKILFAVTLHFF